METEPPLSDTDDNEDDPVIKEIPIIHSKKLEDSLYLFQYPLKRKLDPTEMNVQKCFFKPVNDEVKLEIGLNINSPNFDTGKAEIIAHEVDGPLHKKQKDKQIYFENEMVDKVFLQSSTSVQNCKKYAVAAYNGKEIHLTTLKGIYQFRPVFPYLENGLKKKRQAEGEESDEEEAGPSTAQQVTVKFMQNDEKWKKQLDNNYKALMAKRAEEPWSECIWHDKNSTISNVERLKLISDNTDDIGQAQSLEDAEYIRLLVPEDQEQAIVEPTLPSNIISLHALRSFPIQEQCKLLLKDAQIIQFQQLHMLLAGGQGLTDAILLKTLPKVANLVRGNWVVKSEVLYPPETYSATRGVPAELMCQTRDYVLYYFTKHQYVERKKVSSVMKIPSEEIKEIFTGISKLRHNKGWELSLPADTDFINKHSDIVQKQNAFWTERFNQIMESVKESNDKRQRRKSKSVSEDLKLKNSVSSDNDSGTEIKSPVLGRKNKNLEGNV
ncbi:unnamed protein product [Brassicogethes aeneus]|uniref:DNA-directed RNA polymerase III subunit RPC5 n=1 Tax=Brassicogethes aeneus TaxID=1431903 RepID=A0A9P0BI44_BRAAE|nr:unnamed protein product [Brassicogethes aeneus]